MRSRLPGLVSISHQKDKMINKNLRIKVCGMKQPENIQEVASLHPDYLGFIFYPKSPRNFDGDIPEIDSKIKKTGVFVDAEIEFILEKVEKYRFKAVQLHGGESAQYCKILKQALESLCRAERSRSPKSDYPKAIEIFKVFGIKNTFDFSVLKPYENIVDYFLFDTKGKAKGGNGYTFDWSVLKEYPSTTPIIMSGGIGLEELNKIEQLLKTDLPIHALDLNSKFEIEPGLKDIKLLNKFFNMIKEHRE